MILLNFYIDNTIISEYRNIGETYCKDLYDYIKFNQKYFENNLNIIPNFDMNYQIILKILKLKMF